MLIIDYTKAIMRLLAEGYAPRVHTALNRAIARATGGGCPPTLAEALRYAVFPGGARLRPRLCLAVADACGDPHPDLADAIAAAIELLHCASIVHDDLPCFDNAPTRRGLPSVHRAFGEPAALLVGDGLIVLAFETLTHASIAAAVGSAREASPARCLELVRLASRAASSSRGLVGGQAWELEPRPSLELYHRAKTAALFEAATAGGAIAAGIDDPQWGAIGRKLGEAYQIADDIADATSDEATIGKPVGRDAALNRPSAVREFGLDGAERRLRDTVSDALACVPSCGGADRLRGWLRDAIAPNLLRAA